MKNRTELILGETFCMFLFFHVSDSQFWTFCIDWFASVYICDGVTVSNLINRDWASSKTNVFFFNKYLLGVHATKTATAKTKAEKH